MDFDVKLKQIIFIEKFMHRIFFLFFTGLLLNNVFAQSLAEDFTLTDVNGNTYNLYSELDAGKSVVLNFFITLCGTCQMSAPIIEEIWQNYGYNGDSLWVWGIEVSGIHDTDIVAFMTQYGVTFPCFSTLNDDVVVAVYNITYTPQYYVVCPNKLIKKVNITQLDSAIISCKHLQSTEHIYTDLFVFDQFQLKLPFIIPANVNIYDNYGRTIISYKNVLGTVDISYLKPGLYVLHVQADDVIIRKLLLKY